MRKPRKSTTIGLGVVVAVAAALTAVSGVLVVWGRFGCLPPLRDLVTIQRFEADPLFKTAPDGGRLTKTWVASGACGIAMHGNTTGDGTTKAERLYLTPAVLNLAQLRRLFDQPAAAGGWRIRKAQALPYRDGRPPPPIVVGGRRIYHPGNFLKVPPGTPGIITYCRRLGDRPITATVHSANTASAAVSVEIRDVTQRKNMRRQSRCD